MQRNRDKNSQLMGLVNDNLKRFDRTVQPTTYEAHQKEWVLEQVRAKKAKKD